MRENRVVELRHVSITTVAEHAGVSIATVSRVLNGVANRASAETVRRVREVAEQLGYRPLSVGRALRERRSRLVAVLAPNLANPAMAAIAAAIEEALRAEGLIMILCDTQDRADVQDEYLSEMRAQLARAVVLIGAVESPGLASLARSGAAMLYVNRRPPHDGPHAFIGIDNRKAGADVARFLLDERVADIGAIYPKPGTPSTRDRLAGFAATLAQADVLQWRRVEGQGLDHVAIGRAGASQLKGIMPRGRLGLFCLSDLVAYGVWNGLRTWPAGQRRRVVPVGFDDNPLNDLLAPWLSSIRVPYERFGEAVRAALARIWADERAFEVVLEHRLVVRRGHL
jgi:LacI family transcriptional regulator